MDEAETLMKGVRCDSTSSLKVESRGSSELRISAKVCH